MNEALVHFYRCPDALISLTLGGELSPGAGYFYFGEDAVCYGQSAVVSTSKLPRNGGPDLFQNVVSVGATVRLPFDLSQVVDNLRHERYITNGYADKRAILSSEAFQKAYYNIRPLLPVQVRKHLQRIFLSDWRELVFPAWPVDTTVERVVERVLLLSMKAQKLERIPFIWFWPEGTGSCLMLTHDVETKAGVDFAPRLMDIDDAFGIKASFQVIPEKRYRVSTDFLHGIRDRGFELNVQDLSHDGNLFGNREEFLLRAKSINRHLKAYGALGFRSGRMYRNVDWYQELNISYDMSVPNVAHLEPQRGGCCTVFPYFIGNILELPLTTSQDYTLFHILGEYSINLWKRQIAMIMERHGLMSFIIHPDYVMKMKALEVYKTLLGYLAQLRSEANVWIALPRDVDRWWRERSQMKLVLEEGQWRIKGPGHERARIAYASIDDDRIVYQVAQ
jgi:hypothetical protein